MISGIDDTQNKVSVSVLVSTIMASGIDDTQNKVSVSVLVSAIMVSSHL